MPRYEELPKSRYKMIYKKTRWLYLIILELIHHNNDLFTQLFLSRVKNDPLPCLFLIK